MSDLAHRLERIEARQRRLEHIQSALVGEVRRLQQMVSCEANALMVTVPEGLDLETAVVALDDAASTAAREAAHA